MSLGNAEQAIYRALHRRDEPIVIVVERGARWRQTLADELGAQGSERSVVVVPHRMSRLALDLIRRRRPVSLARPLPVNLVRRELARIGWTPVSAYRLWPSAAQPRVAIPLIDRRAAAWIQQTGVLGGGRLFWMRRLLRSWLLTPLVMLTARATALVAVQSTETPPR